MGILDSVKKKLAGNKSQAARVLGLDRRTLYRKLARFEGQARELAARVDEAREAREAAEQEELPPAAGVGERPDLRH